MASRSERLGALRAAMLGELSETSFAQVGAEVRGYGEAAPAPSAANLIRQLRAALAAERNARLGAEARLRGVMAELVKMRATVVRATPQLPISTEPEVVEMDPSAEMEATDYGDIPVDRSLALRDFLTDPEEEEDNE